MKKLTKFQETALQKAKEMYIDTNTPILFDMDDAVCRGKEAKKKIEELNMSNMTIKESARIQMQKDFEYIKAFFGKYDHLVESLEYDQSYQIRIGKAIDSKLTIFISYIYRNEYWLDQDQSVTINGEDFEQYYFGEVIEVYSDYIGDQHDFYTLEEMFSDNDYAEICEKLITKYIINER